MTRILKINKIIENIFIRKFGYYPKPKTLLYLQDEPLLGDYTTHHYLFKPNTLQT